MTIHTPNHDTRRDFLRKLNYSAFGGSAAASTLLNLQLAQKSCAMDHAPAGSRKTLVCLLFAGGLDGYNLLVPKDSTRYSAYSTSRGNLALSSSSLLDLTTATPPQEYGLHPECSELRDMFNGSGDFSGGSRLSFLSNVGTLVKPTVKADLNDPAHPLPRAIASHFDQIRQWQTSLPLGGQASSALNGWAGRAADLLQSSNAPGSLMNISLAGNNIFQVGENISPFTLRPGAPLGLSDNDASSGVLALKNTLHQQVLGQDYRNLVQDNFSNLSATSLAQQNSVQSALDSFDGTVIDTFGNTSVGNQLREAFKLICLREQLGLERQTIFISVGGWDMHGELLLSFQFAIQQVSQAIGAFQQNLDARGLADSVIGFSTSDFARTLRSNGRGSDHAWGGPQFVFGGPVDSGKIFGDFPDQALDSDDDLGRGGRIIPTRSTDEYFVELLQWFGVTDPTMLSTILPNYSNFLPTRDPIGFIA